MRAVVQRVKQSSVVVNGEVVGSISKGFNVLLGVEEGDTDEDVRYLADKLLGLRVFEDEDEKLNLSIEDVGGEMLVISQFTLLGDARKGRRPSFIKAAQPDLANSLYERLCQMLSEKIKVEKGVFRAHMEVNIVNDGPVTLLLDSKKLF